MTDNNQQTNKPAAKQVQMQRVYLKDASLEVPNAPQIFAIQGQPKIDVQINTKPENIGGDQYEVILTINVTATVEEQTVFLVELQQAGLFVVSGFEGEEQLRILGSYCPNSLFPFAREAIASLIGKGGFPPVLLAPVNFDQLFQQHRGEIAKAQQQAADQPKH